MNDPNRSTCSPAGSYASGGVLGIDIGGANLKYATVDGECFERSFAMWTDWKSLGEQLASDAAKFVGIDHWAITMTGELADCFDGRRDGVARIVDAVRRSADSAGVDRVRFYSTDACFYDSDTAKVRWSAVAASNWHALANWLSHCTHWQSVDQNTVGTANDDGAMVSGKFSPVDSFLLVDVGSTTSDIIAVLDGRILTESLTDQRRLADGSLVYVGCRRTPVCGIVDHLHWSGQDVAVMNEMFATIDDARIWLRIQAEDREDLTTADGKPRDRHHAKARLVRMIGLDREEIDDADTDRIAVQIIQAAKTRIANATSWWAERLSEAAGSPRVGNRCEPIPWVVSGHGQDLIEIPEGVRSIDLRSRLPAGVSRAAPSWAVANLALMDQNTENDASRLLVNDVLAE